MEDKAFDNEETYQKRIQVQEIEINKLNKLVEKLQNETENTSISDGECDDGLKLRRKHKRRRSKSASLQIENEKLKEELSKKFDLELVREANERCVEIERKYKENIKQMKDSIICDKCMKITQENAELNKKLEWMENTIEELQQENKEMEQYIQAKEILRYDMVDVVVRNSELKKEIKQYKTDEQEYSEKIDELILQCDDITQQKQLLINEAETHAKMKTEYMTERNKLKMEQNEMKEHMSDLRIKYDDKCKESDKVRDENNKLLNKVNELGEKIQMLLQDNETKQNETEEVVSENKPLKSDELNREREIHIETIKILKKRLNEARDKAEKFLQKYKSDMKAQTEFIEDKCKGEIINLKRYIDVLQNNIYELNHSK
eukprot:523495_1